MSFDTNPKGRERRIFDFVRAHLLKQNAKSLWGEGHVPTCAYRDGNGLSCAVGCLIPDSNYSDAMEGKDVWQVLYLYPEVLGFKATDHERALLSELQSIHDGYDLNEWPAKLENLATDWDFK